MSNKKLAAGIVIGVVVTVAICYIIYLRNEKEKLANQNDLLKQRKKDNRDEGIINLNTVPKKIRDDFVHTVQNSHIEKINETFDNSLSRVLFLKKNIENRDGYKFLYNKNKPITKESDLHILYDLTWYETEYDVNKEVNNGRGPVDFKISNGLDQTIVEFKLASNSHLKKNLKRQVEIYANANHNPEKIVVIIFTTVKQETRLIRILKELNLQNSQNIIPIDARMDNKPSASIA